MGMLYVPDRAPRFINFRYITDRLNKKENPLQAVTSYVSTVNETVKAFDLETQVSIYSINVEFDNGWKYKHDFLTKYKLMMWVAKNKQILQKLDYDSSMILRGWYDSLSDKSLQKRLGLIPV